MVSELASGLSVLDSSPGRGSSVVLSNTLSLPVLFSPLMHSGHNSRCANGYRRT